MKDVSPEFKFHKNESQIRGHQIFFTCIERITGQYFLCTQKNAKEIFAACSNDQRNIS